MSLRARVRVVVMRTLILSSIGALAACGARSSDLAATKAIFGTLDIKLMDEPTVRSTAPALVSLMVQLQDPDQAGQVFALPECSGIQIGPRQVLTAGHCDRPSGYVFSKNRIAAPGDEGMVSVVTIGPELRLQYTGDLIPDEAADEALPPTSAAAAFKDTTLDAAVFETPYDLPAGWVSLASAGSSVAHLVHYGFPNGLPAAVSAACSGAAAAGDDPAHFRHDCDSMTGSSGGLLIDADTQLPVGMQLAAPGYNLSDYYNQAHHFEGPADFAARQGCTAEAYPAAADLQACIDAKGYNQAVRLTAVAAAILSQKPDLYARLTAAQ